MELPVSLPTAPCLVGTTLVVTTARDELEHLDSEPDAGRVFAADVGVAGPPAAPFLGVLPCSVA